MPSDKIILVTGGTGQQGVAAVRALRKRGWQVRVLTRDPASDKAKAAAAAGAILMGGDIRDRVSVEAAMDGAYGVFCVVPLISAYVRTQGGVVPDEMYKQQLAETKSIIDIAVSAKIDHFILSSVTSAASGVNSNIQNKFLMEDYIKTTALRATFLRPVQFMDNFLLPEWGLPQGLYLSGLAPATKQQMIAVDDIAALAALLFERPHDGGVRIFEAAGDELNPVELAAALSQALGRRIPYLQISSDVLFKMNEDVGRGIQEINAGRIKSIDIRPVRKFHPELMTFPAWLAASGAERLKPLLPIFSGGILAALPSWRIEAMPG